jgi:hypothetical protein
MGALATGIGFPLSATYCGWQAHLHGWPLAPTLTRILLATFLAACLGKGLGLARYHLGRRGRGLRRPPHHDHPLSQGD